MDGRVFLRCKGLTCPCSHYVNGIDTNLFGHKNNPRLRGVLTVHCEFSFVKLLVLQCAQ